MGLQNAGRRRVVVWQRCGGCWLAVLGEAGGAAPLVLRTASLPGALRLPELPDALRWKKGSAGLLVVGSQDCRFRSVDLPPAPDGEVEAMLNLRLETELPWPPDARAWGWQSHSTKTGIEATVLALPSQDVAALESELEAVAWPRESVEAREAGLGQLAAHLVPAGTAAMVAADPEGIVVSVVSDGRMVYSRLLSAVPGERSSVHIALEVEQTLQHAAWQRGSGGPDAVFVAGDSPDGSLQRELQNAGLPVRELAPGPGLQVAPKAGDPADVLWRYPACVGALIAEHERRRGNRAAAPLLRGARPKRRLRAPAGVARLAVLNAVMCVALIASAFAVRHVRLRVVNAALTRAEPALAELAPLEDEVRVLQEEAACRTSQLDLLLAVAQALPEGVGVSELRSDRKGHVSIRGTAQSVEVVSKAVAALEADGRFSDTRFDRTEAAKQGKAFQIDFSVR